MLLPKPDAEGRLGRNRKAPQANGSTHSATVIERSPNGRLHLALVTAFVVSSLIAVVIPFARTQASNGTTAGTIVDAGSNGSASAALRMQAESATGLRGTPVIPIVAPTLLDAAARVAAGIILGAPEAPPSLLKLARQPSAFALHDDGYVTTHVSSYATVGQALTSLGIMLNEHDQVWPSLSSRLAPGSHVYVQHAISARLVIAGVEREIYTRAGTVGQMLAEAGVQIAPTDQVSPNSRTPVRAGIHVSVTMIRDVNEVIEKPIEFDTVYRYDPNSPHDEKSLVQAGSSGSVRREYRVRLINGQEVKRELVTETVTPSTEEIFLVGTYVAQTPTATPRPVVFAPPGDLNCTLTLNVYATWYTAASAGGSGTTATGTGVYKGIVAVDPRVIPLGTHMYIPGYGYGVAADTGSGIIGNMIDLGYSSDDVFDWRTRWVDICILS